MGTRDRVLLTEKGDKERVGQPAFSPLCSFPVIYTNKVYISSTEVSIGLRVPMTIQARRRLTTAHFLHHLSPHGAELPAFPYQLYSPLHWLMESLHRNPTASFPPRGIYLCCQFSKLLAIREQIFIIQREALWKSQTGPLSFLLFQLEKEIQNIVIRNQFQ